MSSHDAKIDQYVARLPVLLEKAHFDECRELASLIVQKGIDYRQSIAPRGTPSREASALFSEQETVLRLGTLLPRVEPDVAVAVVHALGEVGGADTAKLLGSLLRTSDSPEVRRACLFALHLIGGPLATDALHAAMRLAGEEIVTCAQYYYTELMSGGVVDGTCALVPDQGALAQQEEAAAGVKRKHRQSHTAVATLLKQALSLLHQAERALRDNDLGGLMGRQLGESCDEITRIIRQLRRGGRGKQGDEPTD